MKGNGAEELHKEADKLLRAMYNGRVGWSAQERIGDLKMRAAFASVREDAEATQALHRLIYGAIGRQSLLCVEPALPRLGLQTGNTALDALLHFARFHADWVREPEEWKQEAASPREQIHTLARHLFARYPLPDFLDAAWLSGFDEPAESHRRWFLHIGQGRKLEELRFPLPMTHRAAHYFLQAPPAFTIAAALRYGQILALGGNKELARAVAETFLSELQADEPFWFSVITFFVNHPELPSPQIGPVVDYVRYRKFGLSGGDAPEPHFSMKGRTTDALLKRMVEWHEALARLDKKLRPIWNPCGIEPLEITEKDKLSSATCHWRIVEITDTLSLAEEGRDMRHCVRSYQDACLKGKTSIWSLRLTLSSSPTMHRLLTIEVNNARHAIVQVRGKCNRTLSAMRGNQRMMLARDVLRDWASKRHLGIACNL